MRDLTRVCDRPTNARTAQNGPAARGGKCLHDIRLVCPSAESWDASIGYCHSRELGIAFAEYCFQVPANRIGNTAFDLPKLKILQEVITLAVFVPFTVFYMKQPVRLDFVWAGLCLLGAVYFIFRS